MTIFLYAKDLNEPKYQFLIKKREDVGIKYLNDPKAFIEYSQCIDDVYNNIDDYNPTRKREIYLTLPANNSLKLRKNLLGSL